MSRRGFPFAESAFPAHQARARGTRSRTPRAKRPVGECERAIRRNRKAKNELLASVEHEVVAPLGAIVIAAEMAKADGDASTLTDHCLSTILAECSKLERVVEALPITDEREHHGLWWLESRGSIFKVGFSDTSYEGRDIVYAN